MSLVNIFISPKTDPAQSEDNAGECVEILECKSSPCINGASCVDLEDFYECQCVPGYTGRNCEIDINECEDQPCLNGAM